MVFVARACGVVKLDLKVAVPCLVLFEHDLFSVMKAQHHLLPAAALRQLFSRPLCVEEEAAYSDGYSRRSGSLYAMTAAGRPLVASFPVGA